jgi:TetR/AcrR family transcriptional regulator of autoinduction and epiphytic fitness
LTNLEIFDVLIEGNGRCRDGMQSGDKVNLGLSSYRRSVSEAKRKAILKAARDNFLENGYSRAAMADIARDADVSTATLYKHFSSKEVLFAAIIENTYSHIGTASASDISALTAREIFTLLAEAYATQQIEGRINNLFRVVIAEVPTAPHLAKNIYENGILRAYAFLQQVADALVARGDLKPHNTADSMRHLGGMLKEFIVWPALFSQEFPRPDDMKKNLDACVDTYLAIYGTEASAKRPERDAIGN